MSSFMPVEKPSADGRERAVAMLQEMMEIVDGFPIVFSPVVIRGNADGKIRVPRNDQVITDLKASFNELASSSDSKLDKEQASNALRTVSGCLMGIVASIDIAIEGAARRKKPATFPDELDPKKYQTWVQKRSDNTALANSQSLAVSSRVSDSMLIRYRDHLDAMDNRFRQLTNEFLCAKADIFSETAPMKALGRNTVSDAKRGR